MQYPFSILPDSYRLIENTVSQARLQQYLQAADNNRQLALRLYIWNSRLCEALYMPLQLAEIAARNAIRIPVEKRFGPDWHVNHKFINILNQRMKNELSNAHMQATRTRERAVVPDDIVAGLTFGFWVALMTSSYENHLWMNGVAVSFPFATASEDRSAIFMMLDSMRNFRNAVAHHVAIFDRHPQRAFQNALRITKLVCTETHWLSAEITEVGKVINERPKC